MMDRAQKRYEVQARQAHRHRVDEGGNIQALAAHQTRIQHHGNAVAEAVNSCATEIGHLWVPSARAAMSVASARDMRHKPLIRP